MKFDDATLKEVVADHLTWEDFEDDEREVSAAVAKRIKGVDDLSSIPDADADVFAKVIYLNEQRSGDVIEQGEIHRLDFYSLELTSFARLGLAGGSADSSLISKLAVDYDHSYDDIRILVEVMFGVCAVYIKDYSMGYIKPFGDCVYDFNEGPGLMKIESEELLRELLIPRLELDILNGEIDLEKELYDYYHRIPAGNNPKCAAHVNADDFMSVQEAAEALGITEGRVKKLIAKRTLDGYKIGDERALWLSRSQVQERIAYIAEHGKPTRGKARK